MVADADLHASLVAWAAAIERMARHGTGPLALNADLHHRLLDDLGRRRGAAATGAPKRQARAGGHRDAARAGMARLAVRSLTPLDASAHDMRGWYRLEVVMMFLVDEQKLAGLQQRHQRREGFSYTQQRRDLTAEGFDHALDLAIDA